MSVASTQAAQQKFSALRKRLDQLGYRQPLGIESLPLVERLFADLLHTTDSLKTTKLQLGKRHEDHGGKDAQLEPYRSDNARLVKETNELHQQLIKCKEEAQASSKELKSSLRKLEHEGADLKFLNNQYVHKIRMLEKESKQKTDRILQLQEKNFHAVVQTPGGRKKNIPFRRQRMEIDTTVPPGDLFSVAASQAQDPYVADLLKVADNKIAQLSKDSRTIREEKEGMEEKIKSLHMQVDTRDGEIDRLSRLLEGGRPYDVVALESRNKSNERLISHLNIQIDYLQQKNRDLQVQLDEALSKAREASDKTVDLDLRNNALEKELQDVDRMAQSLQLDKDYVMSTADYEVRDLRVELIKSRRAIENLDLEVAQLKAENNHATSESSQVKEELLSERADHIRLEELLDKVQEDKRRLSQRINKLTANERDLVLEIDRLKHKNGYVKKRGKSPNQMDALIKGLEEDRDYWKSEVDVLQKLIKSRSKPGSRPGSRSGSPTRMSKSLTGTPTKSKSAGKGSRSSSPSSSLKGEKGAAHYEAVMHIMEQERDHYKRECELLKSLRSRPGSPMRSQSPTRDRSMSSESELLRVTRERDELQGLLDKFERHMSEIQANVKVLTSERDKLSKMLEEAKEELNRMRRDVIRSPKSPKTSLAAQAVLRRVENERDDATAELRRMTTERDSLRERLKITTESQLAERARLEQRLEDLESSERLADCDRGDLEVRVASLQQVTNNLEDQLKVKIQQLAQAREEAAQNQAVATQMRLLADQAEQALEAHQKQLDQQDGDLRSSEIHIADLEDKVNNFHQVSSKDQSEISNLRITVASLDREKDALQMAVDEKTERIASLEEQILLKDRIISEFRIKITELETVVDRSSDGIQSKEREVLSLRRQLDSTSEELTDNSRAREVALRENKRLQDDLATMTRENQNLHAELSDAVAEREAHKNQSADYITEVKRTEELLAAKEAERSDLLEQYRSLSMEAERYETQTHQLESEGSNLRLELMTREGEVRRLREKNDSLNREVQEHLQVEHSYEVQLSNLTKSVANLEENLRLVEEEKHGVLQDLAAVRDLCTRLEATKDSLQRQLTAKSLDHEKMQSFLDDMKQETGLLRSQVTSERSSVQNLEGLLHSNREKEFQVQLGWQEKAAEAQLLKDRLGLNEAKLESQTRELATIRSRTMELESDAEKLRRQLTNERFERERAVQELRRHGLAPPGDSSGRLSRFTGTSPLSSTARGRTPDRSSLRSSSRSPTRRSPFRSGNNEDDPLSSIHTPLPSREEALRAWNDSTSTSTGAITSSGSSSTRARSFVHSRRFSPSFGQTHQKH